MRSVSKGMLQGVALLTLVAALAFAPTVKADEVDPNQPLEARIRPPIGVTSNTPSSTPERPDQPVEARILPPIGVTSKAPAPPSFMELLFGWIEMRFRLAVE